MAVLRTDKPTGVFQNKTLSIGVHQGQVMTSLFNLNDVLSGCERVVNTPLPVAYSISIAQITYAYVIALPFQLVTYLKWAAIPGTIIAGYIILGLAQIGRELENPFGQVQSHRLTSQLIFSCADSCPGRQRSISGLVLHRNCERYRCFDFPTGATGRGEVVTRSRCQTSLASQQHGLQGVAEQIGRGNQDRPQSEG